MNLLEQLPTILPKAVSWADSISQYVAQFGHPLTEPMLETARTAGVKSPDLIRVMIVDSMPIPEDPALKEAAIQTKLFNPDTKGLTLGYSILIVDNYLKPNLLSHECRHVAQYESHGSIGSFLQVYLEQLAKFGYWDAPLEVEARSYERYAL